MKYIIATLGCKVNQYESEAMEQLPLVQDIEILRAILYAGVWNRYARKMKQKQKERGSTDA